MVERYLPDPFVLVPSLIQPFWALPLLGLAGPRARDIMGCCVLRLPIGGVIIALGLTFL